MLCTTSDSVTFKTRSRLVLGSKVKVKVFIGIKALRRLLRALGARRARHPAGGSVETWDGWLCSAHGAGDGMYSAHDLFAILAHDLSERLTIWRNEYSERSVVRHQLLSRALFCHRAGTPRCGCGS